MRTLCRAVAVAVIAAGSVATSADLSAQACSRTCLDPLPEAVAAELRRATRDDRYTDGEIAAIVASLGLPESADTSRLEAMLDRADRDGEVTRKERRAIKAEINRLLALHTP